MRPGNRLGPNDLSVVMTITRIQRALAISGLTLAVACAEGEVSVAEQDAGSPLSDVTTVESVSEEGPWVATSDGGSRVSLHPSEFPLNVGAVSLAIQIQTDNGEPHARSIDLISPTMPAHGIVRSAVRGSAEAGYAADIDIPMEGTWAVYVNLDEVGGDAAEFIFMAGTPGEGGHEGVDHEGMDMDGATTASPDDMGHMQAGGQMQGVASADPASAPGDAPGTIPTQRRIK